MSRNILTLVLFTILLAGAASMIVAASYYADQNMQQPFPFGRGAIRYNPGDLDFYYVARTIFSTINIVLLVVLLVNYVSIYLKTRSEFTIGLTIFASFFLIKEVAWSPFLVHLAGFDAFGLGPFAFLPDLFELIALSILVYLSVRY
jgi:hypothetical protein